MKRESEWNGKRSRLGRKEEDSRIEREQERKEH